jgi:hypothetical protein
MRREEVGGLMVRSSENHTGQQGVRDLGIKEKYGWMFGQPIMNKIKDIYWKT